MGQLAAYALEQAFMTRWGGWAVIVFTVAAFLGVSWGIHIESTRLKEEAAASRAQLAKAQTLWLSECTKPIDECAAAWDDGETLRRLYRARVPLDRKNVND